MNKKTIFSGVIIAALAAAPFGVKNMVDKSIETKKQDFDNIGVKLDINQSQGYLTSNRDFTITIKNEKKFKDFFISSISEQYPAYGVILDSMLKDDSKKFDDFLKGIVFKGKIENSNINPFSNIQVYTYLNKFSDEIMNEIKKDEEASKILLPLFEKEALAFNMEFDNNSQLKTFVLKDINEHIKTTSKAGHKEEGIFQILGYKVENSSTDKEVIANLDLEKINLEINTKKGTSKLLLNDLTYNLNYENQFINSGQMKINNINFKVDSKVNMSLGEINLDAKAFEKNGIYGGDSKLHSKNLKFFDRNKRFLIDDLDLKVYLDDMNYEKLQSLNNTYKDFEAKNYEALFLPKSKRDILMRKPTQDLMEKASIFLNDGLSLKLDSKIQGLENNAFYFKNIDFDLAAKLKKNNLRIENLNQFVLLSLLDVKANLKMLENDYLNLTKVLPPNFTNLVSMYAKKENGNVVFNLLMEKGKIEVNGQKVN